MQKSCPNQIERGDGKGVFRGAGETGDGEWNKNENLGGGNGGDSNPKTGGGKGGLFLPRHFYNRVVTADLIFR